MAKSLHVPGVPKGFTGHILWIRKGQDAQYYIRLISRNRQIRMVSEAYPTRTHAKRAAKSLASARTAAWVIV